MNKGKITIRKLLGQPAPSTKETIENVEFPQLRPSASQSTTYRVGPPIACLDRSSDGRRAVIAGSKVFKILKVDGPTIKEELDLRAIISSYATSHDLSAATPDQFNIKAVKWSHGFMDSAVITACGNGRITVYDLNRGGYGFEVARIQEHARQVHQLDVNPFRCNLLLSASQDGTVRSFDLRTPIAGRNGPIFRSWHTFKCNADAVRDVKWSPTDGMDFACCTESGQIQKWDIRKTTAPVLKLAAHQKACFSIDWHPDGDHLVSGGADQLCHVWDLSKKADRNQKPRYTFATPAPVSHVSWRPAFWSVTAQGRRAAQITVAYDDSSTRNQNSNVHLWDLARPSMPFKEIEQWDTSPSGLLWNTRDLLWSVDREGHFSQTDVAFSPKVIDRRSLSTFAFSAAGDVLMMLEERESLRRRSRILASPDVSPSFQYGSSGPLLGVSRSDSEEDVVGSFLGHRKKKVHRRRHSGRSGQSFSSTPPSSTGMVDSKIMPLDDAVKVTGIYKPQQVMAIGRAPSTMNYLTYQYFTNRYLLRLWKYFTQDLEFLSTDKKIQAITDGFAKAAENIYHYRLAQTWRLLGYTMNLLLTRRAEYHRQARLEVPEPSPKKDKVEAISATFVPKKSRGIETPRRRNRGEATPRRSRHQSPNNSPRYHAAIKVVPDEVESTSNVATPLVRPVRDHIISQTREAMHTPLNVDDDLLDLVETTPATATTPLPIPVPSTTQSETHNSPSIDGYDFYGVDSLSPTDFRPPARKQPLRLDYPAQSTSNSIVHPGLQRHDSGESFQMFSTSTESQQTKFLSSSVSSKDTTLRDRVHSWENTLSNHPRPRLDSQTLTDSSLEQHEESSGANSKASIPSDQHDTTLKPIEKEPPSPIVTDKPMENPNIIESDYLPQPNDPEFTISPLDATLIERSISFETKNGSLNAAAMILLFRPLLPAQAIDPILANAVIRQYHHRLTTLQLHTEAALLRNLCTPTYPSVFAVAQESVNIGYFCTTCQKPLENDPLIPNSLWRCPRCEQSIDGCAVCHNRELESYLPYNDEDIELESSLWWYCPGCAHGGHISCVQAWHAPSNPTDPSSSTTKHSNGACPLEGCLHPCLPGPWRTQYWEEKKLAKEREMASLVRENSRVGQRVLPLGRGGVRRDVREVAQSKAVEGVRIALGVGAGGERGLERTRSVKEGG
ncbi:WD repeat protein-like protein [Amylocarpus encephaloides]|uniref:WD repeat protein-like protein n=1 Tax=Amylocarpus encephaloides TaxID=45428 RepID=A0A9P7YHZ8_9HELO|nr:WD repeat protein-like protein [Amylocarpus encephaloides]